VSVDIQCVVVGAGVVGLAVARALAMSGREVIVVEAGEGIGTGISSRNCEVITLVSITPAAASRRSCVWRAGSASTPISMSTGVSYQRLGKLIVATDESQRAAPQRLLEQGRHNGVDDLQ
jgi:L-2-hydroxyglutarate oxidase LhgO